MGAYEILESLRDEIILTPDGLLGGYGCKKCGHTNFTGVMQGPSLSIMKCVACGTESK
jgi:hypothetical protein